jgi:hypothetical protein
VRFLSNPSHLTTMFVVVFFVLWAYTEVAELLERREFTASFQTFHDAGSRFTADDGAVMHAQMTNMQRQVDLLIKVESREHPELREE